VPDAFRANAWEPALITTDETFDQDVLQATKPVLLFFTASFCAPSLTIADYLEIDDPVLERVQVARIDIEKMPQTGQKMQVKGTPQLMLVSEGNVITNQLGTMDEDSFFSWLEEGLKKI
jgi:thioredoxin 1